MTEEIHGLRAMKSGGHWILVGNMLPDDCIQPFQKWMGSGNSIVTVLVVDPMLGTVSYTHGDDEPMHTKLAFAFQCRYSLVLGEVYEPDKEATL